MITTKIKNDIVTNICAAINEAAKNELHASALRYGLTVAIQDELMCAVDDLLEDCGVSAYVETLDLTVKGA